LDEIVVFTSLGKEDVERVLGIWNGNSPIAWRNEA
jgi:hypothetical protein